MQIVELSADGVRAAADELARLLLDAHASNMALGLNGPLTRERARFYAAAGWPRLACCRRTPARPDSTLAGSAFYFREL